jgi:hypothetical protein
MSDGSVPAEFTSTISELSTPLYGFVMSLEDLDPIREIKDEDPIDEEIINPVPKARYSVTSLASVGVNVVRS